MYREYSFSTPMKPLPTVNIYKPSDSPIVPYVFTIYIPLVMVKLERRIERRTQIKR